MKRDNLSEEDRLLARRENTALARYTVTFLMAAVYGVIAFFTLWKLKETVPVLLMELLPDVSQSDPTRLWVYATILLGGIAWFVTFAILWHRLDKQTGIKKRIMTLAVWCLAAAAVYAACIAALAVVF